MILISILLNEVVKPSIVAVTGGTATVMKQIISDAATYGNECNAQTDPCAATDHQACVVEDCYKCRCETGYHYVASSNSCTKGMS